VKPIRLIVLVALAAALLGSGCGSGNGTVNRRFLLIGLDGAEWSVIEPLIEQGRMPNIAALMESGVSCKLRSLEPKQKSPVIWTTIATGKLPEKHGITGYVDSNSKQLLTSNVRTARMFWDILGERGLTVTVIGWLVSWPAEVVNGTMVTDYFRYRPSKERRTDGLTYPEELVEEVAPLRVLSEDIPDEEVEYLYDLDNAMTGEEAQHLDVDRMFTEMRAISELDGNIGQLKDFYAGDATFMAVADMVACASATS